MLVVSGMNNLSSMNLAWNPDIKSRSGYIHVLWAMMRENLSLGFANNKDTDQPAHPHRLIRAFVIHFLESISKLATSKISFF